MAKSKYLFPAYFSFFFQAPVLKPVDSPGQTLLDWHELGRFVSLCFLEAAFENRVATGWRGGCTKW